MTARMHIGRMIVLKSGARLFDETFRTGVNIIHGDNGSGKSTIADFIFFGLGGDLTRWKPYASLADSVLLELHTPTSVLTLMRDVSTEHIRPMRIFFGSIDEALTGELTRWQMLPYLRPGEGYNFSQVLFRAIGIPEAISDGASNITMHQILRLLYVDQLTAIQRIFREEDFDPWQIREAVGDLMCGVGGYDLYTLQIEERELSKQLGVITTEHRNLLRMASAYGENILVEQITAAINEAEKQRHRLDSALSHLIEQEETVDQKDAFVKARKTALRELSNLRRSVSEMAHEADTLDYEINDASNFMIHLEQSLLDFQDSSATFSSLGHVTFEFCPSCFEPLKAKEDNVCHLCGAQHSEGHDDTKVLAVQLDLEMQLKESRAIQIERLEKAAKLREGLRRSRAELTSREKNELAQSTFSTGREAAVSEISRQIGFLESEIQGLNRRIELSNQVNQLAEQKAALTERLSRLQSRMQAIELRQKGRKLKSRTAISENTKRVLEQDLEEHSDFGNIEHVSFDFAGDWIAINGDKNRSGSASGMVVLKNSFFLGLLLSSLQDREFDLPRFMLFDNIEDKGMVQERSWNFQRIILKEMDRFEGQFQLILTTSKIAPELAGTEYVVGRRKFTKDAPSLNFSTNAP